MKTRLADLNEHLFAQLERLSDDDLKGEALADEISRANAVTTIAREIINSGSLVLKARLAIADATGGKVPRMLEE